MTLPAESKASSSHQPNHQSGRDESSQASWAAEPDHGFLPILQQASAWLDASASLIATRKYDTEPLRLIAVHQPNAAFTHAELEQLCQSLPAGWAWNRQQLVYLSPKELTSSFPILPGLTELIYAPLTPPDKAAGVLCLARRGTVAVWDGSACQLAERLAQHISLGMSMNQVAEDLRRQLGHDPAAREAVQALRATWRAISETHTRALHELWNEVARRRELQAQVLLSEKMAAVGQLISGVAHELNNPLTTVLGFSELVLMNEQLSDELRRDVQTIVSEAHRARKIVQNLLSFAHATEPVKERCDINRILEETVALKEYELRTSQIEIVRRLAPTLPPVIANADQLKQVFLNIIVNAQQAMIETKPPRRIEMTTALTTTYVAESPNQWVSISIRDTGPGIAEEHLGHIFDFFFTTKAAGQGTGLGLAISQNIVQEHGGRLRARNADGGGAEFIIELPVEST